MLSGLLRQPLGSNMTLGISSGISITGMRKMQRRNGMTLFFSFSNFTEFCFGGLGLVLTCWELHRPKSKYADWEEPPIEGEPFNYDAVPSRFYLDIESAGSLPPDEILQQGIKYLQEKLAAVIETFSNKNEAGDGFGDGVRSPGQDYAMGGMGGGGAGYETPYQGGRTPFGGGFGGATEYGGSANGWS